MVKAFSKTLTSISQKAKILFQCCLPNPSKISARTHHKIPKQVRKNSKMTEKNLNASFVFDSVYVYESTIRRALARAVFIRGY